MSSPKLPEETFFFLIFAIGEISDKCLLNRLKHSSRKELAFNCCKVLQARTSQIILLETWLE